MQAVIMAGGKGTRIASVTSSVPKPMISVCGKPILEHQIVCLKEQGITHITLIVGHMGDIIQEYFGTGERLGVSIDYIVESTPLGTAGALYYLKDKIDDDFLLINGDIIFDVDFQRFMQYHKEKGSIVTILTHPNSHPYDSGIVFADTQGRVTKWLHKEDKRDYYRNRVNAGIHIISPRLLEGFTEVKKTDLDRDVLKPLIFRGELVAYDSPEYVKDMGTPDRYEMVIRDMESGLVHAKNLKNPQRAVFLDRDGTINVYKDFITDPDDLELLPGASDLIKKINMSGYLAIVITNQPVIARGECTLEELEEINQKLEVLLGQEGAYIDDLYYCPHHPDKGFEGERIEYKIDCDCRKPKPGLILKAAKKYNIDLSSSFMLGDDERDMEAGRNAGCNVIMTTKAGIASVRDELLGKIGML